jgi:cytochrome P450
MKKLKTEINKVLVKPFDSNLKIADNINFDNANELVFFQQCINESLRIEAPAAQSLVYLFTENITIKGINYLKGDRIAILIRKLHFLEDEWIEPEKFIPERFDPHSPYYLTPSGNKRDSMSFIPFFGGRRVCLGKSFTEIVTKIVGPSIIGSFDFELVNKEFYQNKP